MKGVIKDEGSIQQELDSSEETEIDTKASGAFASVVVDDDETPPSETRTESNGDKSSKAQAKSTVGSDVRAGDLLVSLDGEGALEVAGNESDPDAAKEEIDEPEDTDVSKTAKENKSISEVRTINDMACSGLGHCLPPWLFHRRLSPWSSRGASWRFVLQKQSFNWLRSKHALQHCKPRRQEDV